MDRNPYVRVGIGTFEKIYFAFEKQEVVNGILWTEQGACSFYEGKYCAFIYEGEIAVKNLQTNEIMLKGEDKFSLFPPQTIIVENVEIGKGFHWQRTERQNFSGQFLMRKIDDKILLINFIRLEEYLKSVISSEMNAACPLELLKAHAIISRSWVMYRILYPKYTQKPIITDSEITTWQDNNSHTFFDVCADDHCQRYQGVTRAVNPNVEKAVEETYGKFLVYDGKICDARFSKCCGGVTEVFESCWQDIHYGYLEKTDDFETDFSDDLTVEENAVKFIKSFPKAFCDTSDGKILSKILNNYDNEYKNFYRWKISYTFDEISEIIKQKSGEDYGKISDLIVLKRGQSGRIFKLKIVGSKKERIIGKELEIRRLLSKSHLYSSAFAVEKDEKGFSLYGSGWGHGVGLCQIGAAVMAENGKTYEEILSHYYKNAVLETMYEKE